MAEHIRQLSDLRHASGRLNLEGIEHDRFFANYQSVYSKTFAVSLLVEFLAVLLFSFIGTTVKDPYGPIGNGLALAALIYTAADISGGHLNPAVTLSILLGGYDPLIHSVLYVIMQITGAIFGSLFAVALVPGVAIGMGGKGPGCFTEADAAAAGVSNTRVFGWETLMTFALISVVYACGVAKPGHGGFTPLAVGSILAACAATGGMYSGAFLNPARVLGPVAVFKGDCGSRLTFLTILGQILAATLSCGVFAFVSGMGPFHPSTSQRVLGLSRAESMHMWVTGSPPVRLTPGRNDENIIGLENSITKRGRAAAPDTW